MSFVVRKKICYACDECSNLSFTAQSRHVRNVLTTDEKGWRIKSKIGYSAFVRFLSFLHFVICAQIVFPVYHTQ